jgi:hypothetical protein
VGGSPAASLSDVFAANLFACTPGFSGIQFGALAWNFDHWRLKIRPSPAISTYLKLSPLKILPPIPPPIIPCSQMILPWE